ncbi:ribosome silencing factor [Devriesea agamarum]|uniref:ribosome silencing factor n=1 Tax=Devriesea agamarum TaxID=472569 RepID=UPI00071CC741|nr:ribosome silencing factor [Devriesea agamarum]
MSAPNESLDLVHTAASGAADKLAINIVAFDVSGHLVITDLFLLCSGSNERHVQAIVDGVEESLLKVGRKPLRREGERDARWVLLDYGDIVVHVQHEEDRAFYALERLWKDCPTLDLSLVDSAQADEKASSIDDAS